MTSKLKPCPFCGGEAKYHEDNGEYQNYVTCQNKECRMQVYGDWMKDPTTISRWNTRAVPDVPELERVDFRVNKKGLLIEEFCPDDGEYVRYDQAAAVISAKDARIAEMEAYNKRLREA